MNSQGSLQFAYAEALAKDLQRATRSTKKEEIKNRARKLRKLNEE